MIEHTATHSRPCATRPPTCSKPTPGLRGAGAPGRWSTTAPTASMIDSRDFLSAKRRAETEVMLPPVPKVAFAGGSECNDDDAIWAAPHRVHAKHPGMVLLHGGSPKGADRIAACWLIIRKVPQIAFKPDFARHKNAAPFKRNDLLRAATDPRPTGPWGIVSRPERFLKAVPGTGRRLAGVAVVRRPRTLTRNGRSRRCRPRRSPASWPPSPPCSPQ